MLRVAILRCFVSGCAVAQAQGSADLMKTPQCLQAREDLDAALSAGGPPARLAAAREQAGLKCLGQKPPPPPEGRFVPPPEPVAPIALRPPAAGTATARATTSKARFCWPREAFAPCKQGS